MLFFDHARPNKYQKLKNCFEPVHIPTDQLERVGLRDVKHPDGSYVVYSPVFGTNDYVLSYGVGGSSDFEEDCVKAGKLVYLFDAQVEDPGLEGAKFFKRNLIPEGMLDEVLIVNQYGNSNGLLKLDVEGWEWPFFEKEENICFVTDHFSQICIEIHSLIEEIPRGWKCDDLNQKWKKDQDQKVRILRDLTKHYYIVHIHGNNHSPRHADLPDCLEVTFVRKSEFVETPRNRDCIYPIKGLDYPNFNNRGDYVLDWFI